MSASMGGDVARLGDTATDRPLIVQSDNTLLLDVHHRDSEGARTDIATFTELWKSPEHVHTYRITPLSLWNAASAGIGPEDVIKYLERWTKYQLPENVVFGVRDAAGKFGKLVLESTDDPSSLNLICDDEYIREEIAARKPLEKYLAPYGDGFRVKLYDRGTVKLELIKLGYPVKDNAPLKDGNPLICRLRKTTLTGSEFIVRDYQTEAARTFHGEGKIGNGYGVVVLPCGAGKTVVGIAAMALLATSTLILTTNVAAVHQWMDELRDKTELTDEMIGEYTGDRKDIKPVTVATYQILTWRPDKQSDFPHFDLFRSGGWGLIIYDEVHLLPAPVFRVTAEIQAVRRLGLTATLIREDGREEEVFSLVGPKRYDVPWKELEAKGWIAEAYCHEIRIDLPDNLKISYAIADKRKKFRIASENPHKTSVARQLIANHREDSIIVIGQYLDQLATLARMLDVPLITGKTANAERERIYGAFRSGVVRVIVVSKVANFAIDLPDASVAIQVSGTFGSRQEEAQRLGRILRPKARNSYFYSVVTKLTTEESFAAHRQKFLTEQGYKYHIEMWDDRDFSSPVEASN